MAREVVQSLVGDGRRGQPGGLHLQAVPYADQLARLGLANQHPPGQGLGQQLRDRASEVGAGAGADIHHSEDLERGQCLTNRGATDPHGRGQLALRW